MLESRESKRVARKIVGLADSIQHADETVEQIGAKLSSGLAEAAEIEDLERAMALLEAEIDSLEQFDAEEERLINEPINPLPKVPEPERRDRDGEKPAQDPLVALNSLFSESVNRQMERESLRSQNRWEPFDLWAVGSSGLLASITDFCLVGLPSGLHSGPITAWMKSYNTADKVGNQDWFAILARELERVCKVPYDTLKGTEAIAGMCGRTHRFQTLGHDPILGFVFGVLDILRGTVSGFSYEKLKGLHKGFQLLSPSGTKDVALIEAFLTQIGHLVSDVATPTGLPAPFTPLLQSFNSGRFGKDKLSLGEVARWMYAHGYDFRHFLSSGLSVGVGKAVLVGLMMLRQLTDDGPAFSEFKTSIKYRRMQFATHSLAALGNAGKITLHQGNPLAINQRQWMALVQLLGPALKDWLLEDELEIERLRKTNAEGWELALERAKALSGGRGVVIESESHENRT